MLQNISRGGNFHDSTPISFIKAYGFYFRVGVIFAKKPKARKTRKLPPRENFHVYSIGNFSRREILAKMTLGRCVKFSLTFSTFDIPAYQNPSWLYQYMINIGSQMNFHSIRCIMKRDVCFIYPRASGEGI